MPADTPTDAERLAGIEDFVAGQLKLRAANRTDNASDLAFLIRQIYSRDAQLASRDTDINALTAAAQSARDEALTEAAEWHERREQESQQIVDEILSQREAAARVPGGLPSEWRQEAEARHLNRRDREHFAAAHFRSLIAANGEGQ